MSNKYPNWLHWIIVSLLSIAGALFVVSPAVAGAPLAVESAALRLAPIDWPLVGQWLLRFLINFVVFMTFGLFLIWLFPGVMHLWAEKVRVSPWKSLGVGTVVLITGFAAALLAFIVILALVVFLFTVNLNALAWAGIFVGFPALGVSLGIFYVYIAFISKVIVSFFLGKLLLEKLAPKALKYTDVLPLALGLVIYLLVRAIPWMGWVAGVLASLIGLGAAWLVYVAGRAAARKPVADSPEAEPLESEAESLEAGLVAQEPPAHPGEAQASEENP